MRALFKPVAAPLSTMLMCLFLLASCSRGVIIAEFPLDNSLPEAAKEDESQPLTDGYWSAFVQMENQDIPHLWRISDMDYALITAHITIPTRSAPIDRTIPLFTLEKGALRTESGVDLLKKIPLTSEAREQVAIEINVIYLKNHRALVATRKILDRMADLVKPFMANYPEAARILESAVALVDDTVSAETQVSSIKKVVDPDVVAGAATRSRDQSSLLVFFLMPIDLSQYRGKGEGKHQKSISEECKIPKSIEHCGAYVWLNHQLGGEGAKLTECVDKPGFLCVPDKGKGPPAKNGAAKGESTAAEGYAAQLASDGVSVQEMLLETILAMGADITIEDIEKFTPGAIENLEKALTGLNEQEKKLHKKCKDENIENCQILGDWSEFYIKEDRIYLAIHGLVDETAAKKLTKKRSSGLAYRKNRLHSLVYITIKFKRSASVYDPLILLPDSRGDCTKLTGDAVDRAQEYFGANLDFFTEDDANTIRATLRLAREYVEIRRLVAENSYVEALRRIGELRASTQPIGTKTGQRRAPTEPEGTGRFYNNRRSIMDCFEELTTLPPTRQLDALWDLYRMNIYPHLHNSTDEATLAARRLDRIMVALTELAMVLDDDLPKLEGGGKLGLKVEEIDAAKLLFVEAVELYENQADRAINGFSDCKQAQEEASRYSVACEPCTKKLLKACSDDWDGRTSILEAQSARQQSARQQSAPRRKAARSELPYRQSGDHP